MKMDIGTHVAKAVQGYISETKDHNEYVAVEFARTERPEQTIFWSGYLGSRLGNDGLTNTQRTVRTLRLLGWEGDDLNDLRTITKNEVEIVVEDEEFNGKQYRKCQFVNELGGGGFKPKRIDADRASRLAEQVKAQINGTEPPPTAADDDKIPF